MADLTLVLEASTATGSVALVAGDEVVAESSVAMRARDGEQLLPAVVATLRTAGRSTTDLGRIVCSAGPGGFTGLAHRRGDRQGARRVVRRRVMECLAAGLARRRRAEAVAPVDAATIRGGAREPGDAASESLASSPLADSTAIAGAATIGGEVRHPALSAGNAGILAILDAMRDEWYVQQLAWGARDEGIVPRLGDPAPRAPGDSRRWRRAPARRRPASAAASFAGGVEAIPLARDIVALAEGELLQPVDLASWEPEYGRLAEAQVKWEAAHGRALGGVG